MSINDEKTLLEQLTDQLIIVKRKGKKVDFNGTKIALAIKKGFDSIKLDEETLKYAEKDINKVYQKVLSKIAKDYKDAEKISVEEIQDIIESVLSSEGYEDVFKSYSEYRERRSMSRVMFSDEKKLHGFIKSIESLGLKSSHEEDAKRENANVDGDTAMGTMLQYGSTVSKAFAKSYLMKPKYSESHDSGEIHIHDMDFMPMGTTTCCQIDLEKLFKGGFSTGHGYLREPNSVISYSALAAIAIQANQNDQHGGQSVPAFDYFMAPGVLKTFKKELKQQIYDLLDYSGFLTFINMDKVAKYISKLESIEFDMDDLVKETAKDSKEVEKIFRMSYDKAITKTNKITYQAMEAFVHNLNTMHSRAGAQVPFSSVNLGTDTTPEGRMVIKNFLLATEDGLGRNETPIFPISIFKIKAGVSYNPEDPNYDLFRLACRVSAKRLFPNFSFLDSSFNKRDYVHGDWNQEVGYMGCRTRVFGNIVDPDKAVTGGRGNLSFTSINLPRLGIKHGILNGNEKADMKSFYQELTETMELIKEQLLERFELQCTKKVYNAPFLLGQGVWIDSEKLKYNDRIRKVLKHGTLSIGFIGLAETLKALTGKHHGEDENSQKLGLEIIEFMNKKCDEFAKEYNLNFTLLATPAEGLSGRFVNIDKAIYGKIPGITDKDYYTNSYHVPVYHKISIADKIKLEGPYHKYTTAGHISYIEVDGDISNNVDAFEKIVRLMYEADMGYGAINHPVDRDPVCGFTGVINDQCPGCGRNESDGVKFERIRRITGYLVGTVDRFNNAKQKEEKDRVKHAMPRN